LSAASVEPALVYERDEAADVRALPLGPEEAYVLSLIDGTLDAEAIASSAGLDPDKVSGYLARLIALKVVRAVAAKPRVSLSPRHPSRASAPPRTPSAATVSQRTTTTPSSSPGPGVVASPVPISAMPVSGEIDTTLSIGIELQTRILDLSAKLSDLDHFQVLGVAMNADRAQVKRAYFSMIGTFHPDTYFGKQLGPFTKRMERIFQRLTEAHDVLTNRQSREEYESYLRVLGRTRALEELADQPPPSVEDLEKLLLQAEQAAANKPSLASDIPAQSPAPARPAKAPPPMPRAPSLKPQVEMVDDPAARRAALARKLGRPLPPAPVQAAAPKEPCISEQAARRSAAVKELHQRYKNRQEMIKSQRVERFAKAAEDALAAGNTISALNTLKIAQTLSGGDIGTVERLGELEKKLGSTVADSYLERARYEEANGHHEQAARSYTRAARAQPSADVFRSAAECYMKAGVELRLAGELAREAVQIAPNRADLRLSLAKIYEAAGMQQSAQRELERALELTPDSDRIKQWLKRIKRGGV
jgi:curved DNA-binding protein CbpA